MKLIFQFCKILSFCFLFFYTFSSCQNTIKIIGSDTTTNKLILVDQDGKPADTFFVSTGQKILWKIKDKNVKHIDSLTSKTSQLYSIFSKEPHKKFLSKTWKAKIEKTIQKGIVDEYFYNIIWIDKAGKSHPYDPKIQVR